MAWFRRQSGELDPSGEKKIRTEGLWVKCENCRQVIWKKDLEENLNVCPKCGKHFRIDARTRLAQLFDQGQYETFSDNLASTDPLKFTDLKAYSERLQRAQEETGLSDAVINARGKLTGRPVDHYYFRVWRRTNDGRCDQPHATGENLCRASQAG